MPPEISPDIGREKFNIDIVGLKPDDWQIYKDLRIKAVSKDPLAFFDTPEELGVKPETEWKKDLEGREATNHSLLFAKSEGKFVGMIGVEYNTGEKRMHVSTIQKLYVDSSQRGHGTGRKLMEAAIEEIKEVYQKQGKERRYKIRLFVVDRPDAPIAMYEKLGFINRGGPVDDVYYDGKYYNQVMMDKFL